MESSVLQRQHVNPMVSIVAAHWGTSTVEWPTTLALVTVTQIAPCIMTVVREYN